MNQASDRRGYDQRPATTNGFRPTDPISPMGLGATCR